MKPPYQPKNKVRIVTASSLFDGHDAAINIMRRIIQATGCEVIHLGHDRSVEEVVNCAIEEDANAIAMTSYQGGHVEYLKFMFDLLQEKKASQIKIFAGGGGTILPEEIEELQAYGITKIYHPDDGRAMGLQGMINDLVEKSDFPTGKNVNDCVDDLSNPQNIARLISAAENYPDDAKEGNLDTLPTLTPTRMNHDEGSKDHSRDVEGENYEDGNNSYNIYEATSLQKVQKKDVKYSIHR